MKKKRSTKPKPKPRKKSLPEGWILPALVDRRKTLRPMKLTAAQRARAMAQRQKKF
ncbi:MAG TPA: hypothetical protein VM240_01515 [Verrucomicrobiae bacterium]|nr:hypothetical protein [Verrucomicrobiae bacterium]